MEDPQPFVLRIETSDVRPLARLLRGVGFHPRAVVTLSEAGLAVQVEEARTMTGVAYVSAALFDSYEYMPRYLERKPKPILERLAASQIPATNHDTRQDQPEEDAYQNSQEGENGEEDDEPVVDPACVQFEVHLAKWLECLNIYGNAFSTGGNSSSGDDSLSGNKSGYSTGRTRRWADGDETGDFLGGRGGKTGMEITWDGPGEPFRLLLQDEDPKSPITRCALKLMDPEDPSEDQFDAEQMIFQIIMKANWLREAISDLDSSCSQIVLYADPSETDGFEKDANRKAREAAGVFRLEAEGNFGRTVLDYPRDLMDVFNCSESLKFAYSFHRFALANRALQVATKISLRIDNEGYLSLQLMMPSPEGKKLVGPECGIIEFKLRALEEEDE